MELRDLCGTLLWSPIIGLATVLLLAFLDIKRKGYSEKLTWKQLFKLYFFRKLGGIKTYGLHRKFERDVRQFRKTQSKFLLDRIRRCENTAFGRDNHLSSFRSVEDFRQGFPVCDFKSIEGYADRMADGEKGTLFGEGDEVKMFLKSSGTTGKSKVMPLSVQSAKVIQEHAWFGAHQWTLTEAFPWDLKSMLIVTGSSFDHGFSKTGHKIGAVSSVLYEKLSELPTLLMANPPLKFPIKNEFMCNYITALFGLRDKQISIIGSGFVYHLLTLMRFIKINHKDLTNDVRRGRIKEDLDIPESLRAEVNSHLSPMPARAAELEREFAKGFDGFVHRIWPELKRTSGIWSGSTNTMYYKEAKELLGPNVPILSAIYMASEGFLGFNLEITRPGPPLYTLIPNINYYEFLPIVGDYIQDLADVKPKDLLLSHEVEVGKVYEIFITNSSGLFRYRMGDVVRVAGFYQQAPQVEFLYRSGQMLNVAGEKMSEEMFFRALGEAAKQWPSALKDYTVASSQFGPQSQEEVSHRYLLFIELEGEPLTEEQTALVEKTLQEQHEHYRIFRGKKKLDDIIVYQVPSGTFARFKDHLLKTTSVTSGQFKMPRVLRGSDRVDWFLKSMQP